MSHLSPEAARARAIRLLESHGLAVRARNARGDSVYLAAAGATLAIRISSHARTAKQRVKHPDVATSIVIREPKGQAQVDAMVEAALGAYTRAVALAGAAP